MFPPPNSGTSSEILLVLNPEYRWGRLGLSDQHAVVGVFGGSRRWVLGLTNELNQSELNIFANRQCTVVVIQA